MLGLKFVRNIFSAVQHNISGNKFSSCVTRIKQTSKTNDTTVYCSSWRYYTENKPKNAINWVDSLDDDAKKQIKLIQNELSFKHQNDWRVPDFDEIHPDDYMKMLKMSWAKRQDYYTYLFKTKHAQENDRMKNEIRMRLNEQRAKLRAAEAEEENQLTDKHLEYGLGKGALFMKIYPRTIDKWKNHKLLQAYRLNHQKLIFDCDFETCMNDREIKNTAKQLALCFSDIRNHRQPYVMHLCNLNPYGQLFSHLSRDIPTITKPGFPLHIHTECFSQIFPTEKLVYLTPDSPHQLNKINADDHYIIGGIVDKGPQKPLTMAKAKKLEIKTARLPLDKFVTFKSNKTLTLDQITRIMLEAKFSRDWQQAFRHIARRKLQ